MTTEIKPRPFKARLGMAGYAAILAEFKREPATIIDLYKRTGIGRDTAYRLVPEMHCKGLLHVSSWRADPARPVMPVYAYGPGADAEPPLARPNGRPIKARVLERKRASPEIVALACVMEALSTPSSILELHMETGTHRDTLKKFLTAMHELGLARISVWQRRDCGGGQYMAMWTLGEGSHAKYPSRREARRKTSRRWRERSAQAQPMLMLHKALTAATEPVRSAA